MHLNLRSLAYFTDLSILGFHGKLTDRGEYIVAETPENPWYYWGNLLVMKEAPKTGDFARWMALFKKEFAHQPLVRHVTFGWDSPEGFEGAAIDFVKNGFQLEPSVV